MLEQLPREAVDPLPQDIPETHLDPEQPAPALTLALRGAGATLYNLLNSLPTCSTISRVLHSRFSGQLI